MSDLSPPVSIVIPTYNYGKFITEAIDSILNSDYPQEQIQIIVIDDGSTDDTRGIIESYENKKIIYRYIKNSGKVGAVKLGVELAQGKYLFSLDADDLFHPEKIRKTVEVFENNEDVTLVAHPNTYWHVAVNSYKIENIPNVLINNKVEGRFFLKYLFRRRMLFGGGSTFAGRTSMIKKNSFPVDCYIGIDELLIIEAALQGHIFFLPDSYSIYRNHENNSSDTQRNKDVKRMQLMLKGAESRLQVLKSYTSDRELLALYELGILVERLMLKEVQNIKKFGDLIRVCSFMAKNLLVFNRNWFRVVKSYSVVNRCIPTPVLVFMKDIKSA